MNQHILPPIQGDSLEIDALMVRYRYRWRYRYLWIAVARLTRQVLAFFVGDRSRESLCTLWSRVPPAYRRKLIDTAKYEVYASFFRPWQHRPSPKGSGAYQRGRGAEQQVEEPPGRPGA